jgi:competence ComEA-like helix-hairpin-helix protein
MMQSLPVKLARKILPTLFGFALIAATLSCAVKPRRVLVLNRLNESSDVQNQTSNAPPRVNLNTATTEELERLPGIGKGLAARIIAHREEYGPFRRAEHLIIVRGISERRFQSLRALITVE